MDQSNIKDPPIVYLHVRHCPLMLNLPADRPISCLQNLSHSSTIFSTYSPHTATSRINKILLFFFQSLGSKHVSTQRTDAEASSDFGVPLSASRPLTDTIGTRRRVYIYEINLYYYWGRTTVAIISYTHTTRLYMSTAARCLWCDMNCQELHTQLVVTNILARAELRV